MPKQVVLSLWENRNWVADSLAGSKRTRLADKVGRELGKSFYLLWLMDQFKFFLFHF